MGFLIAPPPPEGPLQYSSDFSGGAEDPISEDGAWLNGGVVGEDWGNCAISNDRAHGRHAGIEQFGDPTAILNPAVVGTFGPDQRVQIKIFGSNAAGGGCSTEVECRLRSALSAGVNRGYEVFWSLRTDNTYVQIARWNGALGDFSDPVLYNSGNNPVLNPVDGYWLRAQMVGDLITFWVLNEDVPIDEEPTGGQIVFTDSVSDTDGPGGHAVFTDGQPGMGFYIGSDCLETLGAEDDFGIVAFNALELTE